MYKTISSAIIVSLLLLSTVMADSSLFVVKARGTYAIISKGGNQGIKEGQLFYVKRVSDSATLDVGKVKVIRMTANRAAVTAAENSGDIVLEKGDQLFTPYEVLAGLRHREGVSSGEKEPVIVENKTQKIEPIVSEAPDVSTQTEPGPQKRSPIGDDLRRPWVTLNSGMVFPTGPFAGSYQASFMLGASYIVPVAQQFSLGFELNHTFLNGLTPVEAASLQTDAGSILEALLTLRKNFGEYFFIETGGGIYRPKMTTLSADNVKFSYSSTNFGLFAGTGFYLPTSKYAGVSFRARMNNYFDSNPRRYIGFSGGVRFKMQ
jgi:hypothetical protein